MSALIIAKRFLFPAEIPLEYRVWITSGVIQQKRCRRSKRIQTAWLTALFTHRHLTSHGLHHKKIKNTSTSPPELEFMKFKKPKTKKKVGQKTARIVLILKEHVISIHDIFWMSSLFWGTCLCEWKDAKSRSLNDVTDRKTRVNFEKRYSILTLWFHLKNHCQSVQYD